MHRMISPTKHLGVRFAVSNPIRDVDRGHSGFHERLVPLDSWLVFERHSETSTSERQIVFIHGLVISGVYFIPLARALAAFANLHLPDQPGFGRSSGPRDAPSIPDMAELMIRWLDAAGIRHCHLVANSLGCQIAVEMARLAPDRFTSLVLIGPTVDPRSRNLVSQAWRIAWDAPHEPLRLWFNHVLDQWRAGCRRIWQMIFNMLGHAIEESLPEIQHPVLLVRGRNDPTVPEIWMQTAADLLANGSTCTLPGWHCVHYSHPDLVATEIRNFIAAQENALGTV
jgi:2-hydroxy-6-oxonona-2,4-dienedioate hydrolase